MNDVTHKISDFSFLIPKTIGNNSKFQVCEAFFLMGENHQIPLHFFYIPNKIIRLESASRNVLFQEKKDYQILFRNTSEYFLEILPNSKINTIPKNEIHRIHDSPNSIKATKDQKYSLFFSEQGELQKYQIWITYEISAQDLRLYALLNDQLKFNLNTLPQFKLKIHDSEPHQFSILLFGDSISTGANCSKQLNQPPQQPFYGELIINELQNHFPQHYFSLTNYSVGGKDSQWGKKYLKQNRKKFRTNKYDLIILAWGMNDSSGNVSEGKYIKHLDAQIRFLRKRNPKAEFIIISSMLPNPSWSGANWERLEKYQQILPELIQKFNPTVLFADVTSLFKLILSKKSFYDITGNGVNHPNDFGHQLYAQLIFSLLQ